MNRFQYLMTKLSEECGEVQKAIFNDSDPEDLTTELRDVVAMIEMINFNGGLGMELPAKRSYFQVVTESDRNWAIKEIFNAVNDIQYFTSKGLCFGYDDIKPGCDKTNAQMIEAALKRCFYGIGALSHSYRGRNPKFNEENVYDRSKIAEKKAKVDHWMEYAINKGTVRDDNSNREPQ